MGEKVSGRKKRQGKAFEHEWWAGMSEFKRSEGGRVRIHRHYDLSDYVGKFCPTCKHRLDLCGVCHTPLPSSKAQPPRQPSDYEAVWQGVDVLIECKSSRNPASFEMRYIKDHQMCSALNNISAGGEGVFCIQDRSKPRDIKVYCVKADALLSLAHRIGKNSIKWTDIAQISFSQPPRVMLEKGVDKRAPAYDFRTFLESLICSRKGVSSIGDDILRGRVSWGDISAEVKKASNDKHYMPISVNGKDFLSEE